MKCWKKSSGTSTASSNGEARDPRCENCMVHCGYEPTPSLGIDTQRGDTWKLIRYNFSSKPKPITDVSHVDAFTGVTSGRGHLTGKKPEAKPLTNIPQVLAEREVAAAIAAEQGGNGGCCSGESADGHGHQHSDQPLAAGK